MKIRKPKLKKEIKNEDSLGEYCVVGDVLAYKDIDNFKIILDSAKNEQDIQLYLEEVPSLLCGSSRIPRWIIPKKRLGSEHVTDFVIGTKLSMGFIWLAVELENPKAKMFTKAGDPTKELTHAIRQIQDWRVWLKRNQNYAARLRNEGGLGLIDIDSDIGGLIFIGRRSETPDSTHDLRLQMLKDLDIYIHSYDSLLDRFVRRKSE